MPEYTVTAAGPVPRKGAGPAGGEDPGRGRSVAVVGSGVAGLTAAYELTRAGALVTLYEAEDRLGGHAHTQDVHPEHGPALALDTGFLVHNERTYPHLLRLFAELGVATQDSEMSMSVSCRGCGLEYAGARGPGGLLAQPRSLARGRYLWLLAEVPRFHRLARRLLAEPENADPASGEGEVTLREFLRRGRFSAYFTSHFLTPLVASVWSCAPGTALDYPARYLFSFLDNHGLLTVTGSPQWRTVVGGSRTYVERVAARLHATRTGTPVARVRRQRDGVTVATTDGRIEYFHGIVLATHPDQALRLLADPTPDEQAVLGAFRYSWNPTVLHRDASVLPGARRARASWNYRMASCADRSDQVRVSYHLNRLLRLDTPEDYLVTLNEDPDTPVDPARVLSRTVYRHPQYTRESLAAQRRLPELNRDRTAFAGAYHGWGFHEDGCRSGALAAQSLHAAVTA
ncbi:NAD(P)/FAD-dependent oxidoreductase [Streptacidiphilus sp. P02-A3a]|uniref:NAD(P)/FAD-dependent oxidoreductase n=1 Tax=Streptacidiphilus sp. P02-A3a TaxID=2704468 RepID=UPI0015F80AA5|nr:FAD-dependent oxidoreductase [Streptacidiphilus sp. P02-A3a]QMU69533.1 FAD-dependent oxidoreductase [Streptacidiphilus sp. P02-A3a]